VQLRRDRQVDAQRQRGNQPVEFLPLSDTAIDRSAPTSVQGHMCRSDLSHACSVSSVQATRSPARAVTSLPSSWFDVEDLAAASEVASRIVSALGQPLELEGRVVGMSVSVGVAIAAPEVIAEQLLSQADAAMYEAKASVDDGSSKRHASKRPAGQGAPHDHLPCPSISPAANSETLTSSMMSARP
jgi:hypothetical protein